MALGKIHQKNADNSSEMTYIMKNITDYKHNPDEQRMLEASKRRTVFEINHKFLNSRVNQCYVFPRKKNSLSLDQKGQESDDKKDEEMLSELTNVTLYDLSSQNKEIKQRLNQKQLPGRDVSPSDKLLDQKARRTVNKFERKVPSQDIILTENNNTSKAAVRLRIMSQISGRRDEQNEKHLATSNAQSGKHEMEKNTRFSGSKTTTAAITSSKPEQFFIAENSKKLQIATINSLITVERAGEYNKGNHSCFEDQTNTCKSNERNVSQNPSGIHINERNLTEMSNINNINNKIEDQQENSSSGSQKQIDSLILSTQQGQSSQSQSSAANDGKTQKQQVRQLTRKHKPSTSLYQAREISHEVDNVSSEFEQFFEKQQPNTKNPDLSALQVSIPNQFPISQPPDQSGSRIVDIPSYGNGNNFKKTTPVVRMPQQNLKKSFIESNFEVDKIATSQNFRKIRAHVKLDQSLIDFSTEIQPNKALTTQNQGIKRNINFHMIRPSSSTKSNSTSNPAKMNSKFNFENTVNGFQISNSSSNDFNKTSGNLFETLSPMTQSSAKQMFSKINNPIRQRQLSATKQSTHLNKSASKNKKIASVSHGIFVPEVLLSQENQGNNSQLMSLIQKQQQGQQQQQQQYKQLQKSLIQTQQILTVASPYNSRRKEKYIEDSSRPVKTEGDMANRTSIEKSPKQQACQANCQEPNYLNLTVYSNNNNRYSTNTNRNGQHKNLKNTFKPSRQQLCDPSPKDHKSNRNLTQLDGFDYENDSKQIANVNHIEPNAMRPSSKSQSQSNRLTCKPSESITKKQENSSTFLQNISSLVRSSKPVEYVNISTSCSSNKVERLDSAPKQDDMSISHQGTKGQGNKLSKSDEEGGTAEHRISDSNKRSPLVDSHLGQNILYSPMNNNNSVVVQQPLLNGMEPTIKLKRKKKPQLSVSVVQ